MNLVFVLGFVVMTYVPYVISNKVEVNPCKPPGLVSAVVDFTGCDKPPCVAVRGKNLESEITFTPDQDYEKVSVVLIGEVMGVKHGFPGMDGKDGCEYLYTNPGKEKAGCPLKKGVEYVYSNPLFMEKRFLKITANTQWGLKDKKSKKNIFCFEIPIKIT